MMIYGNHKKKKKNFNILTYALQSCIFLVCISYKIEKKINRFYLYQRILRNVRRNDINTQIITDDQKLLRSHTFNSKHFISDNVRRDERIVLNLKKNISQFFGGGGRIKIRVSFRLDVDQKTFDAFYFYPISVPFKQLFPIKKNNNFVSFVPQFNISTEYFVR